MDWLTLEGVQALLSFVVIPLVIFAWKLQNAVGRIREDTVTSTTEVHAIYQLIKGISEHSTKASDSAVGNVEKLLKLAAEIQRLREEHKDIQNSQIRTDEKLVKLTDDIASKLSIIIKELADADTTQAKMNEKLVSLKDMLNRSK